MSAEASVKDAKISYELAMSLPAGNIEKIHLMNVAVELNYPPALCHRARQYIHRAEIFRAQQDFDSAEADLQDAETLLTRALDLGSTEALIIKGQRLMGINNHEAMHFFQLAQKKGHQGLPSAEYFIHEMYARNLVPREDITENAKENAEPQTPSTSSFSLRSRQ
jgi:TPR repeat protein